MQPAHMPILVANVPFIFECIQENLLVSDKINDCVHAEILVQGPWDAEWK